MPFAVADPLAAAGRTAAVFVRLWPPTNWPPPFGFAGFDPFVVVVEVVAGAELPCVAVEPLDDPRDDPPLELDPACDAGGANPPPPPPKCPPPPPPPWPPPCCANAPGASANA